MAGRALVRSPTAVCSTLAGAVAVGLVVAAGWTVGGALGSLEVVADPRFLGGLGQLLYVALALVVVAVAALVWTPFGVAVSYAVGRRRAGAPAGLSETAGAVRRLAEPLYRWTKTRVAVGPLAGPLLAEDDVAPVEVAAGCAPFVVPALVHDASTLPHAVERANRVTPRAGRERLLVACATATAVAAAAAFLAVAQGGGSLGPLSPTEVALAAAVLGSVLTASVDAAWRTTVYLSADWSEGFVGG